MKADKAPASQAPKSAASGKVQQRANVLIRITAQAGDAIGEHLRVVLSRGSAAFGKMGKPLGSAFVAELNEQISQGITTFLFLTTREGFGWHVPYVTYRCQITGVYSRLPEDKLQLVPKYYAHAYQTIGTWFEISSIEQLSKEEMRRIFVISSGKQIVAALNSTTAIFRVEVREAG